MPQHGGTGMRPTLLLIFAYTCSIMPYTHCAESIFLNQRELNNLATWQDKLSLLYGHLKHLGLTLPSLEAIQPIDTNSEQVPPLPRSARITPPQTGAPLTRRQKALAAQQAAAAAALAAFDNDSDSDDEEDVLSLLTALRKAFRDEKNIRWLQRHGVSLSAMNEVLTQALQRPVQDNDLISFFDVISQTRHHEAQIIKKMHSFFRTLKNQGLVLPQEQLPNSDDEQTIRAALHDALRTIIESHPINMNYAPYQQAIDEAYNRLLHLCGDGIINNGRFLSTTESKKVATDLLDKLKPVCEISNLYQQAKILAQHNATKNGVPPLPANITQETEIIFQGLKAKLAAARQAQESMASGRVIDQITQSIEQQTRDKDPQYKKAKQLDAALVPHHTATLSTRITVVPGRSSYIPREWFDFMLATSTSETEESFATSTQLTHNGAPLWKVLPRIAYDLQARRHPTYSRLTPTDAAQWQELHHELEQNNVFADKWGKHPVTSESITQYQDQQLFLKKISTTPGVTPWHEPLSPHEHQLLTTQIYQETGVMGLSRTLEPLTTLQVRQHQNPTELYQENFATRSLIPKTATYITRNQPHQHLTQESDGSFRETRKVPIASVGIYPDFLKKVGTSTIEVSLQSLIHKSFRTARIEFCQKVFKEKSLELLKLLKANDLKKIRSLFRFVPYNPFKSKSLLQLLSYIALHEGLHWTRRKLIRPNFSTALAHKFDQLGSAAFSHIQDTRNIDSGRRLITNHLRQSPMQVAHGLPIPVHPVLDQMVSGRHTLLSPIDGIFSFFVNEGIDCTSARNIRGILNAQLVGNEQAFHRGSGNARPFFYKSEWFQFARRLLISFFTIRSLDTNYLDSLMNAIQAGRRALIHTLEALHGTSATDASQAAQTLDTFATQQTYLTGNSFIGWLFKKLRLPKVAVALGDSQVLFATRIKASLMVNALLALPTIAKLIYIPVKQLIQEQGGN